MTTMTAWASARGAKIPSSARCRPLPCWSPATCDAEPRAGPNHPVSRGVSGHDRWVSTPQKPNPADRAVRATRPVFMQVTGLCCDSPRCHRLAALPRSGQTAVTFPGRPRWRPRRLPVGRRATKFARVTDGPNGEQLFACLTANPPIRGSAGPLHDSLRVALRVPLRLSLRHPLRAAHCLPIRRAPDKSRSTVCSTRPPDCAGGLSVAGRWLGPLNPLVGRRIGVQRAIADRSLYAVRLDVAGLAWMDGGSTAPNRSLLA